MINEPRMDAYRRIVEEDTGNDQDIDEISREIEDLRRERQRRAQGAPMGWQDEERGMDAHAETRIDYGFELESDPFAGLTEQELEELELSPEEIDFTALSKDQQVRYWSLLSPGEKLSLVRLHLQADREEIASRLQLPSRILRYLEQDKFAALPSSPLTIRGYYRAYAQALDLDPEQLIRQYEALTGQGPEQAKNRTFGGLTSFKPWQNKFFWLTASILIVGIGLVLYAIRGHWITPAASTLSVGQWDSIPTSEPTSAQNPASSVDQ